MKLHKSITIKDSSSEEEDDQFDENVENGFFSSDEDDGLQNTYQDEQISSDNGQFSTQFKEMIFDQSIDGILISENMKKLLQLEKSKF